MFFPEVYRYLFHLTSRLRTQPPLTSVLGGLGTPKGALPRVAAELRLTGPRGKLRHVLTRPSLCGASFCL